jgi:hypothetical protein
VSLVVEPERTGILQAACPPRAKRRVVHVKRGDTWVERVPAVHRPQVAVASSTLIFRDTQQSLLSLMILVTVRAIPHVGGDLARVMWSDDLWKPYHPVAKANVNGRRGLVDKPTMTLSARPIHCGSCRAISSRHFVPATPRLDMALLAIQVLMGRSQRPGEEQHFHALPMPNDRITNRQDG